MSKRVFISYTRQDADYLKRFLNTLHPILAKYDISVWYDASLNAGDEFDKRLEYECSISDGVIFFVSRAFLASEYCREVELIWSLRRANELDIILLPVIFESCSWKETALKYFNATPTGGKPIASFETLEEGFLMAAKDIANAMSSSQSYLWKLQTREALEGMASSARQISSLEGNALALGEVGSTLARVGDFGEDLLELLTSEGRHHEHDHREVATHDNHHDTETDHHQVTHILSEDLEENRDHGDGHT